MSSIRSSRRFGCCGPAPCRAGRPPDAGGIRRLARRQRRLQSLGHKQLGLEKSLPRPSLVSLSGCRCGRSLGGGRQSGLARLFELRPATPAPSTPFLGNTEDADPTEISDGPEVDDAGGDNEVGENVDQPSSSEPPDSQLPSSGAGSGQATQLQDRPSLAFRARTLAGRPGLDRA